jgi:hypothetical protein
MSEKRPNTWCGIHLITRHNPEIDRLIEELPSLADMGVNVLVPEVNYQFAYRSHPELQGDDPITPDRAQSLAKACDEHDIRLIPQFQCLGHQSWAETTAPLLRAYPEFDETPGQYHDNEGIYCRSWCPQHPEVNPIIFDLFDELLEAFVADALHVGMDEVFLIGSEHCPRCKGEDPAELFAKAVNDYYSYLVGERHVEMLMWGDRLLDAEATGYGKWEAAENGTHPAIDMIPAEIVICDWHYTELAAYPSIPIFLNKGFRVWPAGWKEVEATEALVKAAQSYADDPNMLGYLCTTWGQVGPDELAAWPPIRRATTMQHN